MSIIKEFKDFALKGNVVQLAVGVIIGAAFGKIVSSLVSDVLMPPIGWLVGGINFEEIKINLSSLVTDITGGGPAKKPVTINIGNFIQTVVDFLIISIVVFFIVQLINRLERHHEENQPAPEPTNEEKLLTEIRDILKQQSPKAPLPEVDKTIQT